MINSYVSMTILAIVYDVAILSSIVCKWKTLNKASKLFVLNIVLVIFGSFFDLLTYSQSYSLKIQSLFLFVSIIVGCIILPVFAYYFTYLANESKNIVSKNYARIIFIANLLSIIAAVVLFLIGKLFIISNDQVVSAPFVLIVYIVELCSTLLLVLLLFIYAKQIKFRTFIAFLLLIIMPVIGLTIEYIFDMYISYTVTSFSVLIQYILLQSKVIAETEMRSKIENELSRTDVMTGLKNRRAYNEFIENAKENSIFGAAFFDVNGLKTVNDTKGHSEGDRLIISFAKLLSESLANAEVFRISGDEFVAIYTSAVPENTITQEIDLINNELVSHNNIGSMGFYSQNGMNIEKMINEAEKLMYVQKREYYEKTGIERRK